MPRLHRHLPVLASMAYLAFFTRLLLQGTVWSSSGFEGDTIRVLLASLPFSVAAFLFHWDRQQVFWFWGACGLANGILIYLAVARYARKTIIRVRTVAVAPLGCGAVALPLWAGCVIGVHDATVAFFRMLDHDACLSKALKPTPNISGVKFEAVYENCDTITKTESVLVHASRVPTDGDSMLLRWANRRTLGFAYDPAGTMNSHGLYDPPVVSLSSNNGFLISVPEVSSISFQSRGWKDRPVNYAIGRITSEEIHRSTVAR
jgi:hypothetical protein